MEQVHAKTVFEVDRVEEHTSQSAVLYRCRCAAAGQEIRKEPGKANLQGNVAGKPRCDSDEIGGAKRWGKKKTAAQGKALDLKFV